MTNETAQPTNGGSNDQLGHIVDALASLRRQLHERAAEDAESPLLLTTARAAALLGALEAAPSLNTLLQALRDTRSLTSEQQDEIDWTSLQTFGGDEPASTAEVWSWDADSLLVGTCADDIKIVSRADWAAE